MSSCPSLGWVSTVQQIGSSAESDSRSGKKYTCPSNHVSGNGHLVYTINDYQLHLEVNSLKRAIVTAAVQEQHVHQ